MDLSPKLNREIILRQPDPNAAGYFVLLKSMFVVDGYNVPLSGRCDTLTYAPEGIPWGTAYEDEGIYLGATSPYTGHTLKTTDIIDFVTFVDFPSYFCFTYILYGNYTFDSQFVDVDAIENGIYPTKLWWGKSIAELLKNIREWSFMSKSPFNSDHPMAIYSNMVIEKLEMPQWALDEIDSMPDMHLARFLKGEETHREILNGFPQMSEELQEWFISKVEQFPRKSTRQMLSEI